MVQSESDVTLSFDSEQNSMTINYTQQSDRSLYDICDMNGRILKTGKLESYSSTISLNGFENANYILLILDGNQMKSLKFTISR
jgi:hypothetical protein